MNRSASVFIRTFLLTLIFLSVIPAVHAQFKAGVQGTVTDTSGGLVPEAKVTLTSTETGRPQETTSNSEGFYRISNLAPGTYTLTTEKVGYKKSILENITVNAEAIQGIDVALEIGEVTASVTIDQGSEAFLETENGSVAGAITTEEVRNMPQAGRDPYELVRLTPGIIGLGARSGSGTSVGLPNTTGPGGSNAAIFQTENQVPISANGQRLSSNNFQIDGVSVNSLQFGGAAVVTPNQESVKEVRVTSSNYSAELGRNSGAQIEVVSQSGSNDFHGSAFFKANDPKWNAFNPYGGIGLPAQRVAHRFRQYGGSLGGPVILPRFGEGGRSTYSGRDRLFFFFSTEALRNNAVETQTEFVETPDYRRLVTTQRPGSLIAQVFNTSGIEPRIISVLTPSCERFGNDPNRCRVAGNGLDLGSLTGGTGQYVSLGNPTGGGFDGIPDVQQALIAIPRKEKAQQYNLRFDYNAKGGAQFTFSSFRTGRDDLTADFGSRGRPSSDIGNQPTNTAITLAYIQPFSATVINEARFSFTRFASDQVAASTLTNFGIPRIEVEGLPFDRIRFGAERAETTPAVFAQNTYEFRDTLRTVMGNHALSFGGQIRLEHDNNDLSGGARPVYSFVGLFNLANETPIFEGINADPRTGGPADAQRFFRTGDYAAFVQDDWKVRPNLTINLGLRYELFTPPTETEGRLTNFILEPGTPSGGRVVTTDKLFETDKNNFAPRFGFAYSPGRFNDKLVVRGGFGISYNRIPNVLFSNTRGNPPFFARFNICCGTAPGDFSTPFAGGLIRFGLGSSNSATSFPVNPALAQGIDPVTGGVRGAPVEIWGAFPETPNSHVYVYSLEAQYEMPYDLIGTLGYQGSTGRRLIRLVDQTLITPISGASFSNVFFPQPDVDSRYNGLNARLVRRFANSFQFEANYRFSSSRDHLSYEGPGGDTNQTNPGDRDSEYGYSDFDVRHHFTASGTYETNFFRGGNSVMHAIFDGFQINGIVTRSTGFPYTPKFFADLRQPSGRFFGPIRPTGYNGNALDDTSDDAFIRPGGNFPGGGALYFTLTPNAPPGIERNSFRGPGYFNVDMSVAKKIAMPFVNESTNLELRANLFNAFNMLNLAPIRFFEGGSIITDPNFGRSLRGLSGRVIELQARFRF
ncbi:MAG TPA: TonB-dependent receptor [Pyrinomonadaceae bacterium]|nr:TonB-dependent receptor [Pyrinomonadaceae bacterium]